MLTGRSLSYFYGKESFGIQNISFELNQGEVLGLLGHNGSGKSTLLKLISGIIPLSNGELLFKEERVNPSNQISKTRLGVLVESPYFYKHLSVKDNLKIICLYTGVSDKKIPSTLQSVGMAEHLGTTYRKLSTGMKQRIGLAGVLLRDPEILILDEPTNGLDPEGILEIRKLILDLKKKGKSMIVSSHLLSEMEKISDKLLILKSGRSVFFGDAEVTSSYRDLESFYFNPQ